MCAIIKALLGLVHISPLLYLYRLSLLTLSSQQQVSIFSYTPAGHLHQGLLQKTTGDTLA